MKKFLCIASAAVLFAAAFAAMPAYKPAAVAAGSSYTSYFNVTSPGSKLKIEPTLVVEPQDTGALEATTPRPASAIVTPDSKMNVTVGGKTFTLASFFDTYLKGRFIPIVRLDSTTVDPFLTWLNTTYAVSDMMAVSDDIAVIEKIYADEAGYLVNTVYDLTDVKLSADRYAEWDHVGAANKAGCNILMYDGSDENLPVAAEYVEALTKVCWAYVENTEEGVAAIAAGCYGIVAEDKDVLLGAVEPFQKDGFARAQYIAAHRGITSYANEQSLTGIMASASEGATHVEIDIQITADKRLVSGHDSDVHRVTGAAGQFINATYAQLRKMQLNNYSQKYGDTFASLDEIVKAMARTDVIIIVELKLDACSAKAVDELKAIEVLKETMDKYPEIKGHWFTITFYGPFAEEMRRVLPEIPCATLGAAASGKESALNQKGWHGTDVAMTNIGGKIKHIRSFNVGLDEMMGSATNTTAQNFLARGYTQNTWTFEDTSHFTYKANVATTNAAEQCAMLVKNIEGKTQLTKAELEAGKATVPCTTYNGWKLEEECEIIVVSENGNSAKVLYFLQQKAKDGTKFGLYSELCDVTVA